MFDTATVSIHISAEGDTVDLTYGVICCVNNNCMQQTQCRSAIDLSHLRFYTWLTQRWSCDGDQASDTYWLVHQVSIMTSQKRLHTALPDDVLSQPCLLQWCILHQSTLHLLSRCARIVDASSANNILREISCGHDIYSDMKIHEICSLW